MEDAKFNEISYADEKSLIIAKNIEFNLLYQVILIFIGITVLLSPDMMNGFSISSVQINTSTIGIILPILLLYFFIRFGYSLYRYHSLRRAIDISINDESSEKIDWYYLIFGNGTIAASIYTYLRRSDQSIKNLHDDPNIYKHKLSLTNVFPFLMVIVINANHIISILFFLHIPFEFGIIWLLIPVFSIAIIAWCYREYYLAAKNRAFLILAVVNTIVSLATILFILALYNFI